VVAPLLFLFSASSAFAATIDPVSFSADPTEDEPVSVTVSGTNEAARTLCALERLGSGACAATAFAEYNITGRQVGLRQPYGELGAVAARAVSHDAAAQASDQYGKTLRAAVTFKPVSRSRCGARRRRLAAARSAGAPRKSALPSGQPRASRRPARTAS
jgi:hypothetical protein